MPTASMAFVLLGIGFIAFAFATMGNPITFRRILDALTENPAWRTGAACASIILGVSLLFAFGPWGQGATFALSLIGWIAALKGFLILVTPQTFRTLLLPMTKNETVLILGSIAAFVIGMLMLAAGSAYP